MMVARHSIVYLFCLVSLSIDLSVAQTQTTLDCNFDSDNFCNWVNEPTQDQFDMAIGSSVNVDGFHSIPRTVTGTGKFAYAQGSLRPAPATSQNQAILRSPQVTGLTGNGGILDFIYWKSALPPVLQVCSQDDGAQSFRCHATISDGGSFEWKSYRVTIPANPNTFTILFVASNFRTDLDLLGIDDVKFRTTSRNSDVQFGKKQNNNYFEDTQRVSAATGNLRYNPIPPLSWPGDTYEGKSDTLKVLKPLHHRGLSYSHLKAPFEGSTAFDVLDNPGELRKSNIELFSQRPLPLLADASSTNALGYVVSEKEPHPGGCYALTCSFTKDLCLWSNVLKANYNWKHVSFSGAEHVPFPVQISSERDAHIYVTGGGRYPSQRAAIRSDDFVVPAGAFLDFSTYMSNADRGRLTVYQISNPQGDPFNEQNVIWRREGYNNIGGRGWHRIRVPLQASSYTMTIMFVADGLSDDNQVLGLDEVTLINSFGDEIGCGLKLERGTVGSTRRQPVSTDQLVANRLKAIQRLGSPTLTKPDDNIASFVQAQTREEFVNQRGFREEFGPSTNGQASKLPPLPDEPAVPFGFPTNGVNSAQAANQLYPGTVEQVKNPLLTEDTRNNPNTHSIERFPQPAPSLNHIPIPPLPGANEQISNTGHEIENELSRLNAFQSANSANSEFENNLGRPQDQQIQSNAVNEQPDVNSFAAIRNTVSAPQAAPVPLVPLTPIHARTNLNSIVDQFQPGPLPLQPIQPIHQQQPIAPRIVGNTVGRPPNRLSSVVTSVIRPVNGVHSSSPTFQQQLPQAVQRINQAQYVAPQRTRPLLATPIRPVSSGIRSDQPTQIRAFPQTPPIQPSSVRTAFTGQDRPIVPVNSPIVGNRGLDPVADQFFGKLARDIEGLFGLPLGGAAQPAPVPADTYGFGQPVLPNNYLNLNYPNVNNPNDLDFIVQNALASGKKRK